MKEFRRRRVARPSPPVVSEKSNSRSVCHSEDTATSACQTLLTVETAHVQLLLASFAAWVARKQTEHRTGTLAQVPSRIRPPMEGAGHGDAIRPLACCALTPHSVSQDQKSSDQALVCLVLVNRPRRPAELAHPSDLPKSPGAGVRAPAELIHPAARDRLTLGRPRKGGGMTSKRCHSPPGDYFSLGYALRGIVSGTAWPPSSSRILRTI